MVSNKKKVTITGYATSMLTDVSGAKRSTADMDVTLKITLDRIVHMRTARKVGDVETINHTMLGNLQRSGIPFTQE